MSLPPDASSPPAYTPQHPFPTLRSQHHPDCEPTRYRVAGKIIYVQVPVHPIPASTPASQIIPTSVPQQLLQSIAPYQPPLTTRIQYLSSSPPSLPPTNSPHQLGMPFHPLIYQNQTLYSPALPPLIHTIPVLVYPPQRPLCHATALSAALANPPLTIPQGYILVHPTVQHPYWSAVPDVPIPSSPSEDSDGESDSNDCNVSKKMTGLRKLDRKEEERLKKKLKRAKERDTEKKEKEKKRTEGKLGWEKIRVWLL